MLFDRARLRAWLAWKDPIDVALDLVAELRVDIRVLQRRLAEIPEKATPMRGTSSGATQRQNGRSPARPVRRKRRTSALDHNGQLT
jgi:hypothetical protein